MPGYPIRKPSDPSSVDSSPRNIAASHVLHRLLMPRHPPNALNNFTPQKRYSHPLYNSQTPTRHTTITATNHPTKEQRYDPPRCLTTQDPPTRVLPQDPTGADAATQPAGSTPIVPHGSNKPTNWLLRKEVIQPHLPVRLPCYDFVPIASPTFDHSPPLSGLGRGLRVLPTFVT